MKKKLIYPLACLAALLAAGCSNDGGPAGLPEETPAVTFRIDTRSAINDGAQLTRLYLGERKPEHATEDMEHLHLNSYVDITGGKVTLEGLMPQWYKFVFLCVPDIAGTGKAIFTAEDPLEGSCDLNDVMIDYLPVLNLSAGSMMQTPGADPEVLQATPDGNIYREVINRWVTILGEEEEYDGEGVTLTRLNGQLIIDMGVLEDQFGGIDNFEQGKVTVTLTVNDTPTRLYVTDNDADEVKTAAPQTISWTTTPTPNTVGDDTDPTQRHLITVNLLPGMLNGSITVNTPEEEYTYPLQGDNGQVSIKKNTQTKLIFNGVKANDFTVQYAGFADTGIDVDRDDWDGWRE